MASLLYDNKYSGNHYFVKYGHYIKIFNLISNNLAISQIIKLIKK